MGDVRCNLFAILPRCERSIEIAENATTRDDVYEFNAKRKTGTHADSSCNHAVNSAMVQHLQGVVKDVTKAVTFRSSGMRAPSLVATSRFLVRYFCLCGGAVAIMLIRILRRVGRSL